MGQILSQTGRSLQRYKRPQEVERRISAKRVLVLGCGNFAGVRLIHEIVGKPLDCEEVLCVRGLYDYYHYKCDGLDDRGWGCGYRTLQTLCSWVRYQYIHNGKPSVSVPGLPEIQKALVSMSDKPASFQGSRDWIGSVEVGLCLDFFYNDMQVEVKENKVPCRILHISSGNKLNEHAEDFTKHFRENGSPLMMGGDNDASSKGILGIARTKSSYSLLILDPHYVGPCPDGKLLKEKNMLFWCPIESFMSNSFYNICLPQLISN